MNLLMQSVKTAVTLTSLGLEAAKATCPTDVCFKDGWRRLPGTPGILGDPGYVHSCATWMQTVPKQGQNIVF